MTQNISEIKSQILLLCHTIQLKSQFSSYFHTIPLAFHQQHLYCYVMEMKEELMAMDDMKYYNLIP